MWVPNFKSMHLKSGFHIFLFFSLPKVILTLYFLHYIDSVVTIISGRFEETKQ